MPFVRLELHIKDGTYKYHTGEGTTQRVTHTTGFYVSLHGFETRVPAIRMSTPYVVSEYCKRHAFELSIPGNYLGIWTDDGTTYLDVTLHVKGRQDALDLARANKQRAIWDIANGTTIDVREPAYTN